MPRVSEMSAPSLPLSGLERIPALQGGGSDGSVGLPILSIGAPFGGAVLAMRVPMVADLSATTDADPGAASVRWNHATPTSATLIFVDDVDGDAGDVAAVLAALTPGGYFYLQGSADSAALDNWQKWQVNSITDASGYTKLGVTLQASAGSFADVDVLEMIIQQPPPSPGVDRNVVNAAAFSSGTVTIDCSQGDYWTLGLTANVTGWSFTNVPQACTLMVRITQDSTPRTVASAASMRWVGGVDGVVSTASGAIDVLALTTFDAGATWMCTLAKAFAP